MRCFISANDCRRFTTSLRENEEYGMKKVLIFLLAPPAIALFVFVCGEVVMHLWNWLVPTLFGWRQNTFWQGLGVMLLCRILFWKLGRFGSLQIPAVKGRALGQHDARGT